MEESLGNILRSAREASAITVDDAVYRAKLPRAVVEALEVGDIGFFASPLYARSFLKQYGDYVGVDVSQWIDDLVPTTLIDSETVESFIDLSDSTTPPATREKGKEKTKSSGGVERWPRYGWSSSPAVWSGGGIEVFKRLDSKLSPPPPVPQQSTAADSAPPETAPDEPEEKPTATTQPEPPRRAIIINLPED